MSTGYECEIVEYRRKEWYWLLQDGSCPVGAWDWRAYCTTTGPFPSYDTAWKHLRDNEANPGGHDVRYFEELGEDPMLDQCIEGALNPVADFRRAAWGRNWV